MRRFPSLIDRTVAFHKALAAQIPAQSEILSNALSAANASIAEQGYAFAEGAPMEIGLSALLLNKKEYTALQEIALQLHRITETILAQLIASPPRIADHFPEHQEIIPFLTKTKGTESWQIHARYDFLIDRQGRMQLLELNVARPGGLMISEAVAKNTRSALQSVAPWVHLDSPELGTVRPDEYVDQILAIESNAGIQPIGIGILHDENKLTQEFDYLEEAFMQRGRKVIRADARDLKIAGSVVKIGEEPISLAYNKFRIRHASEQYDCWKPGFQNRYAAFLEAQQKQLMVSVSNLCGFTLADNKSLLALLHDPEFTQTLTMEEQQFLLEYVPWTHRLREGGCLYGGEHRDLLPWVLAHPEKFVIKPACQSRGVGVVIGRHASITEWEEACHVDTHAPKIVQERAETAQLPIIFQRGAKQEKKIEIEAMNLVLGLTVVNGKFMGVISRISPDPISNVARGGFGQAVFLVDAD